MRANVLVVFTLFCGCILAASAAARADLDKARPFAVLSTGGAVTFGNGVVLSKASNPNAATCPAGTGCPIWVGGRSVTLGTGGKISARETTDVAPALPSLDSYAAELLLLPAVRKLGAIVLKPGASQNLQLEPGLNVISTPAIEEGVLAAAPIRPRSGDPCGAAGAATLTLYGAATDTVVFQIGTAAAPGTMAVCGGSKIALSGGITPDRVTFLVEGKGKPIGIGAGGSVEGTIVAPEQSLFIENGTPVAESHVLDGGILVGGAVTIGNFVGITFVPSEEIGVPVSVKVLGTVDVRKLPAAHKWTTTIESEDDPPQPKLQVPLRAAKTLQLTAPSINGAAPHAKRDKLHPALSAPVVFSGLSQNGKTPSDVQFAAGTSTLLQMVNVSGALYTNPGHALIRTFDLGQFFLGNLGAGTDPRVFYDTLSSNFIVAYEMGPTSSGDDIRLAIGSNPGNVWTVYDVSSNNTGATFDQPKLGVSSDKIILSWNDYRSQHGTSYIVIQKSGIVARHGSVPAWIWTDDTSRFQVVPAYTLSSGDGGVAYGGWRCCGMSNFDLLAFTGVPGISPVNFTDNGYGIGSVTGPPPGHQPAGGDPTINTDDDRLLNTIWQNGHLWGAFNEGCTPQGDRNQQDCIRYVEIGTPSRGVEQNVQFQWSGKDMYYSALTMDTSQAGAVGNLFFGLTFSSPTIDPSAMVVGVPGASFGSSEPAIVTLAGAKPFKACTTSTCPRWGDYTAAVRDPNNPSMVWIVNQYGGLSSPTGFWGTAIGEVHI